ncbi:sugar transferase [Pseudomonas sp. Au-Pse12]|uniref:sugar transferase n=1 Tax=Pseudomonas sp. Au-Pse12 TaxID=2906459 RepID=UPI001E51AE1C|nr:sugar transferase [Pseudomonas sp. Au-Pse12]MCE4053944.1 sugar transferase [Pseudomonas sp. Au-Pse12]
MTLQPAKKVCRQVLFFPAPARCLKWQNILRRAGIPFDDAVQEYTSRHRAQPGISGPAQNQRLPGRNRYPGKTEKSVELHLECIENGPAWFDLYILLRTGPSLIMTREASE